MFQKIKKITSNYLWPWMKTLTCGQLLIFAGLVFVGSQIADMRWELSAIQWELSYIKDKLGNIASNIRR